MQNRIYILATTKRLRQQLADASPRERLVAAGGTPASVWSVFFSPYIRRFAPARTAKKRAGINPFEVKTSAPQNTDSLPRGPEPPGVPTFCCIQVFVPPGQTNRTPEEVSETSLHRKAPGYPSRSSSKDHLEAVMRPLRHHVRGGILFPDFIL